MGGLMSAAAGGSSDEAPDRDRETVSADLIQRARNGENSALSELIETWRTYLLLVANESMPRPLQAKLGASDIVQSACLEIHRHFHDFRGETTHEWKAWLRNLMLRDVQDAHRRYQQTARRDVGRERPLLDSLGAEIDLNAAGVSPRAEVIAAEDARILQSALMSLPEEHRQVIRLRNWEELPFAEIGNRMDRSEDAARKLWSRAIKGLETALKRITEGA